MQSLEVISLNIWQVIISLCNLLLLFLILKKFLFKPVKKVLKQRQDALNEQYEKADLALNDATNAKQQWEEKLGIAKEDAEKIIDDATLTAKRASERIVAEAKSDADGILRQAKANAEMEKQKAKDDIKREIVDVSYSLSEQILGREINKDDHKKLIDSFIDNIGEENDGK